MLRNETELSDLMGSHLWWTPLKSETNAQRRGGCSLLQLLSEPAAGSSHISALTANLCKILI